MSTRAGVVQDRAGQGSGTCQGRAPVPGDQAAVWLHKCTFPGAGEEHHAVGHAVEPVDGASAFADECRSGVPVIREMLAARSSWRPETPK